MAFYTNKKWGDVYGNAIRTPVGRAVFVHLDQPNTFEDSKPKYACSLIFPKSDEKAWAVLYNKFYMHVQELVAQAYHGKTLETANMLKSWITDGDEPAPKSGKIYASHAGHWVLKGDANVSKKPSVIDNQGNLIDPATILPGMLCRFVVTPQVYLGFGGGVSYKLSQVMLVADDGVRLYGGPDPTSIMFAEDDEVFDENAGYVQPPVVAPQRAAPSRPAPRAAPRAAATVAVPPEAQYVPPTQAPSTPAPQAQTAAPAPAAPRRGRPPGAKATATQGVAAQNTEAAAVAVAPQTAPNPAPAPSGPQPAVRSPGGIPQGPTRTPVNGGTPGMRQGFVTPPSSGGTPHQPMPPSVGASMPPKGPAGALKLV